MPAGKGQGRTGEIPAFIKGSLGDACELVFGRSGFDDDSLWWEAIDQIMNTLLSDLEDGNYRINQVVARTEGKTNVNTLKEAYPSHRSFVTDDAFKYWNQLSVVDQDHVIASVELWKKSPQWKADEGKYVIGLSRFLLEERWKTVPPPERNDTEFVG